MDERVRRAPRRAARRLRRQRAAGPDRRGRLRARQGGARARAIAASAYRHGARFVDVAWFDPYVKRARIEHAREETLELRPALVRRADARARRARAARIALAGPSPRACSTTSIPRAPGKDQLPMLKESGKVVNERTTNWTIGPVPDARLGRARLPRPRARRRARAARGASSCTCCGSTRTIRSPPGASAPTCSVGVRAAAHRARASTRSATTGPGTDLTSACCRAAAGRRRASRRSTASSTCRTSRPRRSSRRPTRSAPTAT